MKIFTNLPGNLRAFFGFLRILTVTFGLFWLIGLTVNTWLSYGFGQNTKLIVTVGEIALPKTAEVIELTAKNAKPGSLALKSLRGTLQMDLGSDDPKLVSVVRKTIIPSMLVVVIFSYVLFTALRNLCANIEAGDVFNEENLRLVRRIGLALIGYSLAGAVVGIWCSAVMGVYFQEEVVLTGFKTALKFSDGLGQLQFAVTPGFMTNTGGLVTGCLVLAITEAFRQGLKLKTENDLTV